MARSCTERGTTSIQMRGEFSRGDRGDGAPILLPTSTPSGTGTSSLISPLTAMDGEGRKIIGIIRSFAGTEYEGVWIDGVFERLSRLPGHTAAAIRGVGISRNGRYYAGSYNYIGALWKDGQPFETLYLSGAQVSSFQAVADHGRLAIDRTEVWTRERGVESAASFLAAHGAPHPEGWQLGGLLNINADGSVIIGYLRDPTPPGRYRGFIARTTYRPCFADFNADGGVDGSDVQAFYETWQSGIEEGDVNFDGGVDGSDVETFFTSWAAGGCGS